MKILSVIVKNLQEQIRSYWILLLTLSMGPFFILVYYLILESSKVSYDVLIINKDKGIAVDNQQTNYGHSLVNFMSNFHIDSANIPFSITEGTDLETETENLKNKKTDAIIVLPESFSKNLKNRIACDSASPPKIEFLGDLTNINYLVSAVWANEIINEFALQETNSRRSVEVKESAIGSSGMIDDFAMVVPGIMTVSIIMLMFTASIAFVSEVENRTILRLKLSKLTTFNFIGGIGFVQLLVGVISIFLTLLTAIALGFEYQGSLLIMVLIAALLSLSIIAFGLIVAAITKSSNEVLIVGNFPMFLFMFFTGAAFPLKSESLFTIAGYPVTFQGLMSPTHAISALNKTFVMNMSLSSILPEIFALLVLIMVYFLIGSVLFKIRHMKLT